MKNLVLFSFIFTLVSCFGNKNEFGVLKINAPEGSTFKDQVMEEGVHFYSIEWKRKNEMSSVFMSPNGPTKCLLPKCLPLSKKLSNVLLKA